MRGGTCSARRRARGGEREAGHGVRRVRRRGALSAPRPRDAFSNLQPPQSTRLCFFLFLLRALKLGPALETQQEEALSLRRGCDSPRKGRGNWPVYGPRGTVFSRPSGATPSLDPACRCRAAAMNSGAMRIHSKGHFQGMKSLLRFQPL